MNENQFVNELVETDFEFFIQIAEKFEEYSTFQLKTILDYLSNGMNYSAGNELHKLIGSIGYLGFTTQSQILRGIEQELKSETYENMVGKYDKILQVVCDVLNQIRHYRKYAMGLQ